MPQMNGVLSPTSGGLAFSMQQGLGGYGAGPGPDPEVEISGVIFYFQTSWSVISGGRLRGILERLVLLQGRTEPTLGSVPGAGVQIQHPELGVSCNT